MKKDIQLKIQEMLNEISRIEELVRSQTWEIENQDLPNIEEINDSISDAISTLENASTSNDFTRVSTDDLDNIGDKVGSMKEELTELINELPGIGMPEKEIVFGSFNMLTRSSVYINSTVVNGINNVAASVLYSAVPTSETYHKFYLLLCTLETQLDNMFTALNSMAEENEIHNIDDYVITVKLESKRDLEKHKRNYDMEEKNV